MILVPLFLFEVPGSNSPLVVQELQIGGTSVVLDLTFDWRTRGKTESNVKSPTLGPLLAREAHEYLTGDESRAGVLACGWFARDLPNAALT